jgi:hypothetical protein
MNSEFVAVKSMTCLKRETMQRLTYKFPGMIAVAALSASILAGMSGESLGQPVNDRVLAGYQIATGAGCAIYKINFNFRIRYNSHFPVAYGNELRILFQPIDPREFVIQGGYHREALTPPQDRATGIKAIQYEARIAESPSLTMVFDKPMHFSAAGGQDFQSLIISVGGKGCKPAFPEQAQGSWRAEAASGQTVTKRRAPAETVVGKWAPKTVEIPDVPETKPAPAAPAPAPAPAKVTGPATVAAPAETAASAPAKVIGPTSVAGAESAGGSGQTGGSAQEAATAALITEARSALKQNSYQSAIGLLKRAAQLAENRLSPEARELLGVAYQKDKQVAQAKAVYEEYVRRYPNGEGTPGVRQRLLAIETAEAPPSDRLRTTATIGPATIDGTPAGPAPGTPHYSVSGSASSTYIRDDTYSVTRDRTQAIDLNKTADDYRTHQNQVVSSFDTNAQWGNGNTTMKFRFSGENEYASMPYSRDTFGVSSLYLDTSVKDWGTTFRLGRQTRNSDGILGRFDGAVFTYQYDPLFGFTTFGGSPVEYRTDTPLKDDRYFYGGALNFGPWKGFDADVYAIEQKDRDILDRRSVGAEFRYTDMSKAAFVSVDYDIYFDKLDAAIFTGSWTLPDKSTIRLGADYRMAPYLTAWNALQGQPFTTLYDLLKVYTQSQAMAMAVANTSTYQSATAGYTRQLTDKLQVNLDVTQAHIKGAIPSFNIDGSWDTGNEFYYGVQLVGTSMFTEGDMYSAAFRYSDLADSNNFAVDLSTRYPVTQSLGLQPHVMGSYSQGKTGGWEEYTVLPSLLIDYYIRKDLNLEVEIGDRLSWTSAGTSRTLENELLITAGVRYDFYADSTTCLTPSVFCRVGPQ